MPRVGEFCKSNVARLLLSIAIVITVILCIGLWFFYSSGHGSMIKDRTRANPPASQSPHQ